MDDQKPSWGKTIGAFFLCGCLAIAACIITSSMLVSSMGFSGYSNGGLLSTVTGVACAAYYRSTGKLAGPVVVSIIVGVALGFLAVQIALSMSAR